MTYAVMVVTATLRRIASHRSSLKLSASAVLLFPIRMFVGFGWLRAAIEKMVDASWWSGDYLQRFVFEHQSSALPFMTPLMNEVFAPSAVVISVVVPVVQLMIGIAFVTAWRLRPALWAGVALNVLFVAMGAVDPSAFYIVIQLSLLAAVTLGVFGEPRRKPNPVSVMLKTAAAVALAPFATTLRPAEVIHDPAVILVTVALLAAATETLGWFVRTDDTTAPRLDTAAAWPAPHWPPPTGGRRQLSDAGGSSTNSPGSGSR